ncbi:MAG: SRPBCC family protein [Sphingomonadales bacterium]|nr:SRPBCC family protein [Sphingomonadales bacterium]
MKHKSSLAAALLSLAALAAGPAQAKVIDQSDIGFTVAHTAQVAASPEDVWKMLRLPDKWWSKDHSWSGDAANFWLDSQAGGCFCEKLPGEAGGAMGSVQHARIIFAKPNELMRLSGAFGPLQGEAVTGTLTIQIKKTPTGSAIRFDYVVGGYMRFKVADVAPAVDKVLGEQLVGLARALGGSLPVAHDDDKDDEAKAGVKEGAAKEDSGLDAAVADLVGDKPKDDPEGD